MPQMDGVGQEGSSQEVTPGTVLCLSVAGSENGELSAFKSQLNFWDSNIFSNVLMPNHPALLSLQQTPAGEGRGAQSPARPCNFCSCLVSPHSGSRFAPDFLSRCLASHS